MLDSTDVTTFTVFTPTYNRAETLCNVYMSLLNQTYKNYEWIIVDDGSSDGTEEIVTKWVDKAEIIIKYYKQNNKGKHVAYNYGVSKARGELFLVLDSDDTCKSNALERFKYYWDYLKSTNKHGYSTISALCVKKNGSVIGNRYPEDIYEAYDIWDQVKNRLSGDRWGVNKTDILKKYLFPIYKNELFIPEGLIWNRLSKSYKTLYINEVLKVCEYHDDGLSKNCDEIRIKSPHGTRKYYSELAELPVPTWMKARSLVNYFRFSFHGKVENPEKELSINSSILVSILEIIGYLAYLKDKLKI